MNRIFSQNKQWLALWALVWVASSVEASSFKCGNRVVETGDVKAVVLNNCGEPIFKEVISADDERKIEQWTYRSRGYRSFVRVLTFRGGRLSRIEIGDRLE